MTLRMQATAFWTIVGDRHIPINMPSMPGIDDQLIAEEESLEVAKNDEEIEVILYQRYKQPIFFG